MLEKNYADTPNITFHQLGISNKNGSLVFNENILHSTSSFEELNLDSKYLSRKAKILGVSKEEIVAKRYEVNVITLFDYINTSCNTDIDILKIDTEGHEYYCLEGLFLDKLNVKVKYIQIEEHNDDMYLNKKSFKEIEELLNKNDFFLETKIRHGFGDFVEAIFKNRS